MSRLLIIRADAGPQIGSGHVLRCLALGQAWKESGGEAVFVMARKNSWLAERLQLQGMETHFLSEENPGSLRDAQRTAELAQRRKAYAVVLDGYHFKSEYQHALKEDGFKIFWIDDLGQESKCFADLILNQNPHAREGLYPIREKGTRLLFGTRYILLRREFLKCRLKNIPKCRSTGKILVTLGGADSNNATLKILEGLQKVIDSNREVTVIVGGDNPHFLKLQEAVKSFKIPISLERNVTSMPEKMLLADLAIAAAGGTCWELAFLGIPTLTVILAENQRPAAEALAEKGAIINLGWYASLVPNQIAETVSELRTQGQKCSEMSRFAQELIDGRGPDRVLMHLEDEPLWLRDAEEKDCAQVWKWANAPEVREVSFNRESIPWEKHVRWYENKIHGPSCCYYIGMDRNDISVGQVRYDIQGKEAVISVSMGSEFQGQGYGSCLIRRGSRKFFASSEADKIHAYIKPGNQASIRVFENAGFRHTGMAVFQDSEVLHFSILRNDAI